MLSCHFIYVRELRARIVCFRVSTTTRQRCCVRETRARKMAASTKSQKRPLKTGANVDSDAEETVLGSYSYLSCVELFFFIVLLVLKADFLEAELSDGGDSTDEESSEYSGLEEEDGDDDSEEGEDDEDDDDDDEELGDSSDEDDDDPEQLLKAVEKKSCEPVVGEPSAAGQPVEDEYAQDSSDEEACFSCNKFWVF